MNAKSASTMAIALILLVFGLSAVSSVAQAAVSVSPVSATLPAGATATFTATVTGTTNPSVTWSVPESSCGSVTQTGTYTAPNGAALCHVVATSVADATKSGAATATVTAVTTKTAWVWIGNTGLYPWGCSTAAGCTGSESDRTVGNSFYADIQAHLPSFTHVSITLYTLNQCDATCTNGIAYQSGRPFLASCTPVKGYMCATDGPDVLDGYQATRANLVATYHGLGMKVSALVYAGIGNGGTDKGAAAIMCGGSTATGQSAIDPTLQNVCAAQQNFINAMVSEAQTNGYDDINLDWELGSSANGSDADLGSAPTFPKITDAYAQAFSNFVTNFKSALQAAGLATTISVDAINSNVNGSWCSGNGGYLDAQVLSGTNGALISRSLDYVIVEAYSSNLVTSGTPASGYPPASCGVAPTWANNYYGSDILDSSSPASCDSSLTGFALMMCPPNWGPTLAIDASRVIIGLYASANGSNPIAGQAMQRIEDYGFQGIAVWPGHDGSAASASFMSTVNIDTSGFTLGGCDWYQMFANWLAAP